MRPAAGPEQDLETVRLMRQAVGPYFDLMVDAPTLVSDQQLKELHIRPALRS